MKFGQNTHYNREQRCANDFFFIIILNTSLAVAANATQLENYSNQYKEYNKTLTHFERMMRVVLH